MNLSTRTSRAACALAIFAVTLGSSAPAFSIDQVTDRLAESRGGGITAPFGSVDLSSNVSGYNRPVTLPSYPDRPQSESQRPRPPVYRPSQHRPQWGYVYPTGNKYFAGTVRCESFGSRYRSCFVPTRGRVVLERRHNGRCRYGNGWGYDRNRIWVRNNCRATFAYGIGSYVPRYRSDNNDTALIIGGVAVAAGLIAILARSGNDSKSKPQDSGPARSAAIVADFEAVQTRARPGFRACVDRAALNIGATGGSKIQVTDVTIDNMGSGTYRFDADIRASYPDKAWKLAFSCTAKGSDVEDFDFIND